MSEHDVALGADLRHRRLVACDGVVAESVAETNPEAARALFYLAVGIALSGDAIDAAATLHEARDTDPDHQTEWISELSVIGITHPAALQLIPHLLEALP